MIDIKQLEKKSEDGLSYFDQYKESLTKRGASFDVLNQAMELNKKKKELITQAETAKANQNKASGEVAKLKREGKDAGALTAELGKISGQVKEMETAAAEVEEQVKQLMLTLPNKLHADVPFGKSTEENKQIKLK